MKSMSLSPGDNVEFIQLRQQALNKDTDKQNQHEVKYNHQVGLSNNPPTSWNTRLV